MKKILYLIITLLILEIIKTILTRFDNSYFYFTAIIISAIQFLVVIAFIVVKIFHFLISRISAYKNINQLSYLLFLAIVAIMEMLFSFWLYHPEKVPGFLLPAYSYYYNQYEQKILQFDHNISHYNNRLFYSLMPDKEYEFINPEFSTKIYTNASGFRDDNKSLHQPSVVCLGDSYTMGWGVEQQEGFTGQIEEMCSRRVLNAGVPSYGTAREIISMSCIDTSNLDYLVIQYCTNDQDENNAFAANGYSLKVSSEDVFKNVTKSHKINNKYFPGKRFLLITQIFLKQQINALYPFFSLEDYTGKNEVINKRAVKRFLDIVARSPVDFSRTKVILLHLDRSFKLTSQFKSAADSLLQTNDYKPVFKNSVTVADVSIVLMPDDYYILDPHLRASGHRKVARLICDYIR